jgi:hypothetical protein
VHVEHGSQCRQCEWSQKTQLRYIAGSSLYRFRGSEVDGRTTTRLAGAVSAAGQADLTLREGATSARIILLPHTLYLKANAAYWKAHGGSQAAKVADKLAGRWFKTTDASLKGLVEQLTPKHVAACLTVGTGTLKEGGTSSVGGKRAVVVIDRGDKPATTPGRLYVAATAPILPLRAVQTGKEKARRPRRHALRGQDGHLHVLGPALQRIRQGPAHPRTARGDRAPERILERHVGVGARAPGGPMRDHAWSVCAVSRATRRQAPLR